MTRRPLRAALLVLLLAATTGCSSFQGQLGRTDDTFIDAHDRVCTVVKWGDSASLDCDFVPEQS